ncbi:MAG TPA: patatin-like phospholipase family protein, partial [Polyangiaceae bacterium]
IAMKNLDTKRARQLERRVAKEGDETTACELRKARMVMDRERANEILSSPTDDHVEMLELAQSLKQYKDAGTARRVLALSCDRISKDKFPGIYRATFQQAALATYKDPDLPIEWKLDRAHELLTKTESLAECRDSETLGIAGAIFKRRWEYDGQRQNLERALFYYLKGYAQGAPAAAQGDVLGYLRDHPDATFDARADQGYTGVNAAFVLDLLAAQEEEEAHQVGFVSAIAKQRRECARAIRQEISRSVPALLEQDGFEWLEEKWWFYATLGEALFGLGEYERALEWLMAKPRAAGLRIGFDLDSSVGLQVPEWEYESTARQLAQLGRMQSESEHQRAGGSSRISEEEFTSTPAAQALKRFLRGEELAVRSSFRGKFGLGLSGGGFRASFFHIGVLARLAEIDALGHVEVLSCVSGGSIVGAYYYLEVRKLLQTKADAEITPQDYVEIVKRLETEFLAGVQRNIRMRVLGELSTNLKMIFSARYSRTLRVGELYERELYARITDSEGNTSPRSGPRWLPDLFARLFNLKREQRLLKDLRIYPKIGVDAAGKANLQTDFSPRSDNWRRRNKAPILVLNASSLNTGHNWQFTASYMGEPPLPIQADIDCNYRLRRFYFDEQNAPTNARPITLGQAVAASSCVPGLFEPIILDDLYPDDSKRRISVRLVDGGVCDNQGVASLLEQDCTMMLVSDGSGQMDAEDVPSAGLLGVPLRSNSILQARVRETQYGDIESRRRAKLLRGLMFVHLKQDLPSRALAWRNCPPAQKQSDVYELSFDARAETSGVTRYGVSRDIQRKLAAVRTDLDSFSDAEAYALMASGYCMAAEQFRGVDP